MSTNAAANAATATTSVAATHDESRAFASWRRSLAALLAPRHLHCEADTATDAAPILTTAQAAKHAKDLADAAKQEEKEHVRCERWKKKLLQSSPMIKFMMENLERSGCPFREDHFRCTPCEITRAGGFAPEYGVILCQNSFLSKQHMEDTMTHELVHAYDECTTKVDWNNAEHYACSVIRAASLSGECKFTRELRRGFVSVAKHHQACVKRRAIAELKQLPQFQGERVAEDAVRAVWDRCFADTAPFDEIP
ncbi:Mitochondrial inner membrane protease atp23 [Geranomyces michiganensis]|nr:Mitochondrial inner membrane protease atp23 [Geranomyces michiganensis]